MTGPHDTPRKPQSPPVGLSGFSGQDLYPAGPEGREKALAAPPGGISADLDLIDRKLQAAMVLFGADNYGAQWVGVRPTLRVEFGRGALPVGLVLLDRAGNTITVQAQ